MKLMQAIVELLTKEDRDRDKYEVRGHGYTFWYSFRRDEIMGRYPSLPQGHNYPFEYFFSNAHKWCRLYETLDNDGWSIISKGDKPKPEPKRGIMLEEGWQLVGFHAPASYRASDASQYATLKFKRKDGILVDVHVPVDREIKEGDF